jgi:pyruvate kinase
MSGYIGGAPPTMPVIDTDAPFIGGDSPEAKGRTTPINKLNFYSPSKGSVEKHGQPPLILAEDMSELAHFPTDSEGGKFGDEVYRRKSKIICTMGPKCWDVETLTKLIDAGMNVARLNFSHGDHKTHGQTVLNIREAAKLRPDKYISILLDTKGPEIRTGFLKNKDGISLKGGQELTLVTENYADFLGDESTLACSYDKLAQSVKPGNIILCADGTLSLKVKEILSDTSVKTIVR